jgi:ketosteroid isomerase-like protein
VREAHRHDVPQPPDEEQTMTPIDVVQAAVDSWNNADRQEFIVGYTDDCEISTPTMNGTGHDAAAAFWTATMGSLPDGRITEVRLVADGETVCEEAVVNGTNTGPAHLPDGRELPPTGRPVRLPFAAVHTVRDGKIAASRFYWDTMTVVEQLGLLTAAP